MSWAGALTRRLLATPDYWWAGMLLAVGIAGLAWVSRTTPVEGALVVRQALVEHRQAGV